MRYKAVNKVELKLDKYTEEDGQIDTVKTDFINCNANSWIILAKLKTSSYQNSVNISYKIHTGSKSNILPFCIYKILFPRSTKKPLSWATSQKYSHATMRQLGTSYLTWMNKVKQNIC